MAGGPQPSQHTGHGRRRLHVHLAWRLAIIATLPVVLVVAWLSYSDARSATEEFTRDLQQDVRVAARQIEAFLNQHLLAVETLADAVALQPGFDTAMVTPQLANTHRRYGGFVAMRAADPLGWVIAASPALAAEDETAQSAKTSVFDRNFFQHPLERRQSFVSNVLRGRGFGAEFFVAVSAPVINTDGSVRGVIEGSLNLDGLSHYDPWVDSREDETLLLLDRHDRVVYSTDPVRYPVLFRMRYSRLRESMANTPAGTTRRLEAENGADMLVSWQSLPTGWKVIGARTLRPLISSNLVNWLFTASLVFAALGVALASALAVTRRITGPLGELARELQRLEPGEGGELPAPEANAPLEIGQLFTEFRRMLSRLDSSFAELHSALAESRRLRSLLEDTLRQRDEVIAKRTEALRKRTAQLHEANAALEQLASEDGLTGLANRRAFDEALARIWRVCERDQSPMALMMVDADHFKAYNDHYGHPQGDEALRRIAEVLGQAARRPLDLVARYGGEEFAIILGGTRLDQARETAEELRRDIDDLEIAHGQGGARAYLTISAGIAVLVPGGDRRPADLVRAADEALYQAKSQGRNQVVVAPPPGGANRLTAV